MRNMADILNSYILPGRVANPLEGLEQARLGEQLGLGGIVLSERWDSKELGSVMGALSQVTQRVRLIAGITHFGTRHPLVQAGMSATMQMLSGGRFVLGFGRSVPTLFRRLGIPVLNNEGMIDYVDILRKLWAGETVRYSGPAGNYPEMELAQPCAHPPPVIIGAVGPKTLALAGAHFDGILLHPFLTVEGVARSAKIVRDAASAAGRDPTSVRIYAIVVAAPDTLTLEQRRDVLEARAVSYFMHRQIGQPIIDMNGWDDAPMNRLVETGLSRLEFGQADAAGSRRQLAAAVEHLPPEWLETGAASGSTSQCADRLGEYLKAGADEILLHGTTPGQQGELVEELRRRPL